MITIEQRNLDLLKDKVKKIWKVLKGAKTCIHELSTLLASFVSTVSDNISPVFLGKLSGPVVSSHW